MFRATVRMLIPLHLCLLATNACAVEPPLGQLLKGRVHLAGSIVDAACAIRVGNENQTVTLHPETISNVVSGEVAIRQPLDIYITRCMTSSAEFAGRGLNAFKVTFEGDNQTQFTVHGSAKGIGIQIMDDHGTVISPGVALDGNSMPSGSMALRFFIALVGTGHLLEAGDFHATIKLRIQHF
ncbi:type 1 fimbrial protein [Pseudomonas sp. B21-012]|uniref:fimbrial protein n=1 Tax=Pseudomonas sp. B21-012 TaxID=2895472 RepID=UPI000FA94129|nr:fimbrial protein [Pseudomonas sp. B21-012]UVM58470.1 type 1 fimbrial protein [Pseudomonas sp. B21-012]